MHSMFVILFCFASVVGINGAWLKQPASIDKDAVELTRLVEEHFILMPAMMKRAKPLVYCQIIDYCCNDEDRTEAVSLFGQFIMAGEYRLVQTMKKCINSTSSNKGNQLCSSIVQSIVSPYIRHPDMRKYENISHPYYKSINTVFSPMESICNSEEIHSLICSSKATLTERCFSKTLQKMYDDNTHNYRKNVLDVKEAFTAMNQQLSIAFI